MICRFSSSEGFGDSGEGFIHVHHLRPLAEVGRHYDVNHISDLIPEDPNCHAMLYRKSPPYTFEELRLHIAKISE